ncbi:MAG: hypothetical protein PVH88_13050 [Ignavibacteria bacterium]|jgi:hypothetical protein
MKEKTKKTIDFIIIMVVFAVTGSTTAFLSGIIMTAIGVESWTIQYILIYIILIFPIYQMLILIFAAMFGKFNFFYSKQKILFLKVSGYIKEKV